MANDDLGNLPGLPTAPSRARHILGTRPVPFAGGGAQEAVEAAGGAMRLGPPDERDIRQIADRLVKVKAEAGGSLDRTTATGIARRLVTRAQRAMRALETGSSNGSIGRDDVCALEAVIHVRGRPALRVLEDGLGIPDTDMWRIIADEHRRTLLTICQSVAAVQVFDQIFSKRASPWIQGTAWMVSHDLAITNRHVLFPPLNGTAIARRVAGTSTARTRRDYGVMLNFAHDNGPVRDSLYKVADIPFVAADTDPIDVAILRVELVGGPPVAPLRLSRQDEGDLGRIYVIGHPGRMPEVPDDVMAVFGDPDERKRVSFGEVVEVPSAPAIDIPHDASTIGGYSGGGLFGFLDQAVEGLHYFGSTTGFNRAIKASALLGHPSLDRFLK